MAKSKDKKSTKKKTKAVESPVVEPVVETKPVVEEKIVPKKNSLLPSSVSKPLEDLKRRVETLESAIANILLFLDKK